MEMLSGQVSVPLSLTPLTKDESSVHEEDVRDEMRTELIMLNAALTELNKKWDFSDVFRSLLTDQGPAFTQIPRLKKQMMERMIKIRDAFLRKEQERKEQERKEQEQQFFRI